MPRCWRYFLSVCIWYGSVELPYRRAVRQTEPTSWQVFPIAVQSVVVPAVQVLSAAQSCVVAVPVAVPPAFAHRVST